MNLENQSLFCQEFQTSRSQKEEDSDAAQVNEQMDVLVMRDH